MPPPYLPLAVVYAGLGALAAAVSALAGLMLPPIAGLSWLRVHLVTIGVLAEAAFGLLPALVAARTGRPIRSRWDVWALLNLGLLILVIGLPPVNRELIQAGGGLVFAAVALLVHQLVGLGAGAGPARDKPEHAAGGGRFYLAGFGFLLIGVTVGTGLWLGWSAPLRIANPLETHIHANVFGFLSLTLAGLVLEALPAVADRPPIAAGSARTIFRLLALGAAALVLSPWLGVMPLMLLGILLHLGATVWLLRLVARPPLGATPGGLVGRLHLVAGYAWFLAPILAAPLVRMQLLGSTAESIEQSAPRGLIFGWALPIAYALIPFLVRRALSPSEPARLGGSWLSLLAAQLGAALLWASILLAPWQTPLEALASLCWAVLLLTLVGELRAALVGARNLPAGR